MAGHNVPLGSDWAHELVHAEGGSPDLAGPNVPLGSDWAPHELAHAEAVREAHLTWLAPMCRWAVIGYHMN